MGKKWWIFVIVLASAAFLVFGKTNDTADLPAFYQPEQTVAALATSTPSEVEFPYVLRETGLILQNLARYDGLFPEDEGEREVVDAAALMVYNPGERWIRSVKILVTQGGQDYLFEITYLPPNSRVLVVEKNAQCFSEAPVESCRCLSLSSSESSWIPAELPVTEALPAVENLTGQALSRVVVYYKQYISDGNFYLGGYTCQKELKNLGIGECRQWEAYRYVPGYSRVVAVEWKK